MSVYFKIAFFFYFQGPKGPRGAIGAKGLQGTQVNNSVKITV